MAALSELFAAIREGDVAALDRTVAALGGARPMLRALIADADARARALAEEKVTARHDLPRLDVAGLIALGPVGLWVATEWVLAVVPGRERSAPSPAHEQWDALLEVHRARPEAPWLPIELLASLGAPQRSLGHRILLGLERRFGDRARHVARARLAIGPAPLADLLERAADEAKRHTP